MEAMEMMDESNHPENVVSPEDALRLLKSGACDCIVSDFQMPPMGGIELALRIRGTGEMSFIIYVGRGSEHGASAIE